MRGGHRHFGAEVNLDRCGDRPSSLEVRWSARFRQASAIGVRSGPFAAVYRRVQSGASQCDARVTASTTLGLCIRCGSCTHRSFAVPAEKSGNSDWPRADSIAVIGLCCSHCGFSTTSLRFADEAPVRRRPRRKRRRAGVPTHSYPSRSSPSRCSAGSSLDRDLQERSR